MVHHLRNHLSPITLKCCSNDLCWCNGKLEWDLRLMFECEFVRLISSIMKVQVYIRSCGDILECNSRRRPFPKFVPRIQMDLLLGFSHKLGSHCWCGRYRYSVCFVCSISSSFWGFEESKHTRPQLYSVILTVVLCLVVFGGVKIINKVSPAFLIPVLVSLFCIFIGIFTARSNDARKQHHLKP